MDEYSVLWGSELVVAGLALGLAVEVAFLDGLLLVVEGFSTAERDLDLDQVSLEINPCGYKSKAFLLDLASEALDLLLVNQEAAVTV